MEDVVGLRRKAGKKKWWRWEAPNAVSPRGRPTPLLREMKHLHQVSSPHSDLHFDG
jgi:hypothetical protein